MPATRSTAAVHDALKVLHEELSGTRLVLEIPDHRAARHTLTELMGQIDDYLLPRLKEIDAPLLAVVGGSTGAGKSTLVNSIIGREVSPAGVLRPTTRVPALVCHPDDAGWFSTERILPDLPRFTGSGPNDGSGLHLVTDDDVPRGLALLDAPDIDSVVESNRRLAAQLLAAADLWIFVTTAARYADAVPWELLRTAQSRSTALALVLNRVPPDALEEVPGHVAEMLKREELARAPILTIPEVPLRDDLIPADHLAPLSSWLSNIASDAHARAGLVAMTLEGALDSLESRVEVVATHLEKELRAAEGLVQEASDAYSVALREIDDGLSGGALLRGEVLARWHEFVGTGDVMRSLQGQIARARDRVAEIFTGRPPVNKEVRSVLGHSVETVVLASCDKAAERTLGSWTATPQGRALVARGDVPRGSSTEVAQTLDAEVRAWQSHVLDLVSQEGANKRTAGRVLSLGVNTVGVALMIAVFAQTGGLSGGEVLVAGGTATVSQKLLEALFGDQAVRELAARARSDLLGRIDRLLERERERFGASVTEAAPSPHSIAALRTASEAVQGARR